MHKEHYKYYLISLLTALMISVNVHGETAQKTSSDSLTLDSLIELIQEEENFDMDAYQENLVNTLGGEDYKRQQALREQLERNKKMGEERENQRRTNKLIALIASVLIALIPVFEIVRQVVKGELKPGSSTAILKTAGMLLGYGVLLFVVNYFGLLVLLNHETKIMGVVCMVLLLAFVIFAIYTLRKSSKQRQQQDKN